MTFGCRPPVSHDLSANAAPATGRQPRRRSASRPPLLMYTCVLRDGALEHIHCRKTSSTTTGLLHTLAGFLSSRFVDKGFSWTKKIVAVFFCLLECDSLPRRELALHCHNLLWFQRQTLSCTHDVSGTHQVLK